MHELPHSYEQLEKSFHDLHELILSRKENELINQLVPKTQYTFKDIQGVDLLNYAVALSYEDCAKVDKVLGYLEEEKNSSPMSIQASLQNALAVAIWYDDLELVKKIAGIEINYDPPHFIKNPIQADLSQTSLSSCQSKCKEYVLLEMQKDLARKTNDQNQGRLSEADERKWLLCAAAIRDINFIQDSTIFANLDDNDETIFGMLLVAIENNNLSVVKFLFDNKKNIDLSGKKILHHTISSNATDVFDYLLSKDSFSRLLSEKDETGVTPLIEAIDTGKLDFFKKILLKDNQLDIKLINSDTILHCASHNLDMFKLIVEKIGQEKAAVLVSQENVYGNNVLDLAKDNNINESNQAMITYLKENFPTLQSEFEKTWPITRINQTQVLHAMHYYMGLFYRNEEHFPDSGHCNGFTFLWEYYTAKGKRDHFFQMMSHIVKWDGSIAALEKEFEMPVKSDDNKIIYRNLKELFEGWINDVIWFQHAFSFKKSNPSNEISKRLQYHRKGQLAAIRGNNESLEVIELYCMPSIAEHSLLKEQIKELLNYLSKMPINTSIEFSGSSHVVTIMTVEGGLSFYDSNRPYKTKKVLTIDEIANLLNGLSDYKEATYAYSFYSFAPANQSPTALFQTKAITEISSIKADSLNIFYDLIGQKTIPSKDTIDQFQDQSANRFTPLHLAVLSNNLTALDALINEGHSCFVKNAHGKTPLDMINESNNMEAKLLFIKHELSLAAFDQKLDLLLEKTQSGSTFLASLAEQGNAIAVKELLELCKGSDYDEDMLISSLLTCSLTYERAPSLFELLFEHSSAKDCHSVLQIFSPENQGEIVKDIFINDEPLFFHLAKQGQYNDLQLLLEGLPGEVLYEILSSDFGESGPLINCFTSNPNAMTCLHNILIHLDEEAIMKLLVYPQCIEDESNASYEPRLFKLGKPPEVNGKNLLQRLAANYNFSEIDSLLQLLSETNREKMKEFQTESTFTKNH